jgi:hypothetical protein
MDPSSIVCKSADIAITESPAMLQEYIDSQKELLVSLKYALCEKIKKNAEKRIKRLNHLKELPTHKVIPMAQNIIDRQPAYHIEPMDIGRFFT